MRFLLVVLFLAVSTSVVASPIEDPVAQCSKWSVLIQDINNDVNVIDSAYKTAKVKMERLGVITGIEFTKLRNDNLVRLIRIDRLRKRINLISTFMTQNACVDYLYPQNTYSD